MSRSRGIASKATAENLRWVVARFWAAHAARVQISATLPKPSDSGSSRVGVKVRDREDAIASTRAACAPQNRSQPIRENAN